MIRVNDVVMHKGKYHAIKDVNDNGVYFKDLEDDIYCKFARFEDVTELTKVELSELFNNQTIQSNSSRGLWMLTRFYNKLSQGEL